MNSDSDPNAPIAELVARYMSDAHRFVQHPQDASYEMLDQSFRALRAKQQRAWPRLRGEIDALGCAACDLVNALEAGLDARALVAEHERALDATLTSCAAGAPSHLAYPTELPA